MFTFKKTTALKYIAVAAFLAMAACGTKDNNVTPAPETPKDRYLIKTAVHKSDYGSSSDIDSVAYNYNSKYQLSFIRFSNATGSPQGFHGSDILTYDDKGRLIYGTGFDNDNTPPDSYDSIAWVGQKATLYVRWESGQRKDTSKYEYNNIGQPISLERNSSHHEYTYQNGDLVKHTKVDTWGNRLSNSVETYEYDTMPNPFHELYLYNPYFDVISSNMYHLQLPSKHNVTKVTITSSSDGGPSYTSVRLYENKYNTTTLVLEAQTQKYKASTGDTARSTTAFTYIKAL